MRELRALGMRLRGLLHADRADSDLAAELESHLQLHIEDYLRAGLTPEEARRQALIRLGGLERTKQAWRERHGLPWLEVLTPLPYKDPSRIVAALRAEQDLNLKPFRGTYSPKPVS